jgi:hypothetical protein
MGWRHDLEVEYLPRKHKALSSNSRTNKKSKKEGWNGYFNIKQRSQDKEY